MARDLTMFDRWGYEVVTSSYECISLINSYYHQVLSYGRERDIILEAPKIDPKCVLGNILAAHFLCSADSSRARELVNDAKAHLDRATAYEKAVFDSVVYMISPDRDDDVAVELHANLLRGFPKDLVSLKRAQVLCFYMGRPDLSLQLVEQVLPINEGKDYIYGMLAFSLLELGRMKDAQKAARKGFEINDEDPWSQHALCHVYQHRCHFKEAVTFMEDCSKSWTSLSSFMYTHNWWHVALCYLEAEAPMEKVRDIYDNFIWQELERSDATPAEVYLNAAGLMLRVYIRGRDDLFKDHFEILSECLKDRSVWFLEWHLDILILWTLSHAEEFDKADELLNGLKSRISNMKNKKKQELMLRGLMLAQALYNYGKNQYKEALEFLGDEFDAINYKMIGASDEQVDVFNEVYFISLLNTGEAQKAVEAIEKQLKKRGRAPFLWRLMERAYAVLRKDEEAADCSKRASELQATYMCDLI